MKISQEIKRNQLLSCAIVCVLIVLFLYSPIFLESKVAVSQHDGLFMTLPSYTQIVNAYKNLRLPLWNPLVNLGQPIRNGSALPFSILIIPYLFLSPEWANTIAILVSLWLVFYLSWVYFRIEGFSNLSASVGTIVYALSGPVFFMHSDYAAIAAFFILPLVLIFLRLWEGYKKSVYLILLAVSLLIASQSINPDFLLYAFIAIIIKCILTTNCKKESIYISIWCVVLASAYLTASTYLVPLKEWMMHSARSSMTYGNLLYPGFMDLCLAISIGKFIGKYVYPPYYFYLGLPAIILAVIGFLNRERKDIINFFLFSLLFPVSYLVFWVLYNLGIDFLGFMDHWRVNFIFSFGLAGMAGLGAGYLWDMANKSRKKAARFLCISFLVTLGVMNFRMAIGDIKNSRCIPADSVKREMSAYNNVFNALESESGSGRLTSVGGYRVEPAMLSGVRSIPSYTNVYNKNLKDVLDKEGLVSGGNLPLWWHLVSPDAKKLAPYGVRYLLLPRPSDVLKLIPPEFGVGWRVRKDITLYKDWRKLSLILENSHYRGRSYLISSDGIIRDKKVGLEDISPEEVVCRVSDAEYGDRLILADLAFPGWEADINGKIFPWKVYNHCLREIEVPPGDSIVVWKYKPVSLRRGFYLSLIALLVFFLSLRALYVNKKE